MYCCALHPSHAKYAQSAHSLLSHRRDGVAVPRTQPHTDRHGSAELLSPRRGLQHQRPTRCSGAPSHGYHASPFDPADLDAVIA